MKKILTILSGLLAQWRRAHRLYCLRHRLSQLECAKQKITFDRPGDFEWHTKLARETLKIRAEISRTK